MGGDPPDGFCFAAPILQDYFDIDPLDSGLKTVGMTSIPVEIGIKQRMERLLDSYIESRGIDQEEYQAKKQRLLNEKI